MTLKQDKKKTRDKERGFVPRETLVRMELLAMLAASVVLMVLALWMPPPLGSKPDPVSTPVGVRAPWIFAGVQEMLRYLPPLLGGVVVPLSVFLFIGALPFLQPGTTGEGAKTLRRRLFPFLFFVLLVLGMVILSLSHFLRPV